MLHFVFPQDPLNSRVVDEYFAEQRFAFRDAGFSTSIVPESVFESGKPLHGLPPGAVVVYRGWMVDATQYKNFVSGVQGGGATPLTSISQYLLAHHLPNWYDLLRDVTPETKIYPADADVAARLRELNWPAFFVKDYVKSLKTGAGSLITDPDEAVRVVDDMQKFRGTIEGGFCVRRVESFRPGSELRYFVLQGEAYSGDASIEIPEVVRLAAERVQSPFFSVDVAIRESEELRIVEIGDGQVSDLVGWNIEGFVRLWARTA